MNYILLFIAYFVLVSALHRFVNRPKKETLSDIYGGPSPLSMSITEWVEKNREIPPYLKSSIEQIQDDEIKKVIVKKDRTRLYDLIVHGESFELKKADGTIERINPGNISHLPTIKTGVQCGNSDHIQRYIIYESKNNPTEEGEFTNRYLSVPYTESKAYLEQKFQKDFDNQFGGMAIVEDILSLSLSMRNNAVDRWHIKTWIDQWLLNHGDLDNKFKRNADAILESQFKPKES